MATIRYIKDQQDKIVLPITHEHAVIDSLGVNLETKLSQIDTNIDNKQAILVSGENIKTINNSSLLGDGNLEISGVVTSEEKQAWYAKQDALVAGTNIKTINGTSLLGGGNMEINADTSSCEKLDNKVTSISESSTDTQYPSAKSVYSFTDAMLQYCVVFPVFSVDNSMHLIISSPTESALSLFSVDPSGHLIMTIN